MLIALVSPLSRPPSRIGLANTIPEQALGMLPRATRIDLIANDDLPTAW